MKTRFFVFIKEGPNIVELSDERRVFGKVEEITSRSLAAGRANISKVTLWGADFVHYHKKGEETYICLKGKGEIFLNGQIFDFIPGTRVIIRPITLHAARPKNGFDKLIFLCLSSPAFDPSDVYNDKRGRRW